MATRRHKSAARGVAPLVGNSVFRGHLKDRPRTVQGPFKIHSRTFFMPSINRQLLAERASRKSPQGRRVRLLFQTYLDRLGPGLHDAVIQAGAIRAAELAVMCEDLRARALAGDAINVNDITRLEFNRQAGRARSVRQSRAAGPATRAARVSGQSNGVDRWRIKPS